MKHCEIHGTVFPVYCPGCQWDAMFFRIEIAPDNNSTVTEIIERKREKLRQLGFDVDEANER